MISPIRHSSALAFLCLGLILAAMHCRMCLYPFAWELRPGADGWYGIAVAVAVYLLVGAIIGRTGYAMKLFTGYCAYPIFLFGILATGVFVPSESLSASLVALCLGIGQICMVHAVMHDLGMSRMFYSAFSFGVAACLEPACAVCLPVLVAVCAMVSANPRRYVATIVGFLLPFAAVSYVQWYAGHGIWHFAETLVSQVSFSLPDIHSGEVPVAAAATFVSFLGLEVTSVIFFASARSQFLRERQTYAMVSMLLFSLLAFDVMTGFDVDLFPAMAVPGSLMVAYTMDQMKESQTAVVSRILAVILVAHLFVA